MNLPKELTTVTPLSKALALIMFIFLPIVTFGFGMKYQQLIQLNKVARPSQVISPTPEPIGCTMDAKICPDGTAVGRIAPNCEFEKCPSQQDDGKVFSGTITSLRYDCHMDGICGVGVGKGFVIVDKGEGPPGESRIKGSFPEDLMNEDKESFYIGKSVEIYAAQSADGRSDSYTLFGNADYYIKLIDNTVQSFCGGIAGTLCPSGYYCKYDGTYPDAGGTCIKDKTSTKLTCPKNEWVDCMPGPGVKKTECAPDYLKWAQSNCPNFKGAAY